MPKNVSGTALLAFLQPGCRFCGAIMPFYRDLQEQARKGTSLVGMTSGEEKTLRAYLAGYGVTPDEVVHVRFPEYGVWATPTLQLIDKTGKVLGQWVGQLNSQQEADIKERLLKD